MENKPNFSKANLTFWCKTSVIDKMVVNAKGRVFNDFIAKEIEKMSRHYFVINKQGDSKIVPGVDIETYKVKKKGFGRGIKRYVPLTDKPISDPDVKEKIIKFCKEVHNVEVTFNI